MILAAAVSASACERTDAPATEANGASDTTEAAQITVLPRLSWDVRITGVGAGLVLITPVGQQVLRLSCLRDPPHLTLEVEPLQPIGSEERLSFGIDDESFLFVADPTADRPAGVYAEAPIDETLLDRLLTGHTIGLSYGAQVLGPYRTPDLEVTRTWVNACRGIAGSVSLSP
jgi:hypothetical protein